MAARRPRGETVVTIATRFCDSAVSDMGSLASKRLRECGFSCSASRRSFQFLLFLILSLLMRLGGDGERGGTRTLDLLIKSQLLYRLSYALARWRARRIRAGPE
jgi:hypothetical protein